MNLVIVLLSIGAERFGATIVEALRFSWFNVYVGWLRGKCPKFDRLNDAVRVILLLTIPLSLLVLIDWGLGSIFMPLSYLFALFVLIGCLGPVSFYQSLYGYLKALDNGDGEQMEHYEQMFYQPVAAKPVKDEQKIIESIFIAANERFYAVFFWFIVLGPFGAALYRFADMLKTGDPNTDDAGRRLSDILNWPAACLFVLGQSLAGSMSEALSAWNANEDKSLAANRRLLTTVSLGALGYQLAKTGEDRSYWPVLAKNLINRTFIIWLVVLGVMTISGTLA